MKWLRDKATGFYTSDNGRFIIKNSKGAGHPWDTYRAENGFYCGSRKTLAECKTLAENLIASEISSAAYVAEKQAAIDDVKASPTCPAGVDWLVWHNLRHDENVTLADIRSAHEKTRFTDALLLAADDYAGEPELIGRGRYDAEGDLRDVVAAYFPEFLPPDIVDPEVTVYRAKQGKTLCIVVNGAPAPVVHIEAEGVTEVITLDESRASCKPCELLFRAIEDWADTIRRNVWRNEQLAGAFDWVATSGGWRPLIDNGSGSPLPLRHRDPFAKADYQLLDVAILNNQDAEVAI